MDDDELENVAGGEEANKEYDWSRIKEDCWYDYTCFKVWNNRQQDEYGHDGSCGTLWHCSIVTLHTEAKAGTENCWKNNKCDLVHN